MNRYAQRNATEQRPFGAAHSADFGQQCQMGVQNSQARNLQHFVSKNISASEDRKIRRPLPHLSSSTLRILIPARDDGESISTSYILQAAEHSFFMPQEGLQIRVANLRSVRDLVRTQFCDCIFITVTQTPLTNFAEECAAVPRWQGQSANGNVPELGHTSGDGTASLAIGAGAQYYDAHCDASGLNSESASEFLDLVSQSISTWRVRRCSSSKASARNLPPQLINRIGWYAPQIGYDPATPPTTSRRPFNAINCLSISFILRAAFK